MSGPVATYAFLPWLRRGLASEIARPDGTLTGEPRASVAVKILLDAAGDPREIPVPLALHGPGEVAGVDPRVVIRSVPKAGEIDAEPSNFVSVEFDQADFAWRYTAAKADASARLKPWLVLVVATTAEIKQEAMPSSGRLGAVTFADASALPDLSQSFAWAHAQVEAFDAAHENLEDIVRNAPRRTRSRLLCPRRLSSNTAYRAFLVPAFERGRKAGLGELLDETIDALQPAWQPGDADIRLPIYFEWRFQTGLKGDFETLARRLVARPVDDDVGKIAMDVGTPDSALIAASASPLAYEGALVSPKMKGTDWPAAEREPFVAAIARLLNQPADNLQSTGGEATLGPPLWGRWHAAKDRLDPANGAQPIWFNQLNSDPRTRVAAGLGAEIIRRNDQQLMAAAWNQVEGLKAANTELRRAQLAREAAAKLHARHFELLDPESFFAVTATFHARFTASQITIRERLRRSPIPDGALEGPLRRVMRPQGAIARRTRRMERGATPGLLARLNAGSLRARPPLATPTGMLSPERVERVERGPQGSGLPLWLSSALVVLALLLVAAGGLLAITVSFAAALLPLAAAGGAGLAAEQVRKAKQRAAAQGAVAAGMIDPEELEQLPTPPEFVPALPDLEDLRRTIPAAPAGSKQARQAAAQFREALADLVGDFAVPLQAAEALESVDLPELRTMLFAKMNPRATIADAIRDRLEIADWVYWKPEDPLEPIMAAPEFDTPMYEPLRDYGQTWIMPGIGTIPPDTVTLVKSNQAFIEAYMAGLNDEMGRELLYHEYPIDQRGTYFRQFWDPSGAMLPSGALPDPESLKDIQKFTKWKAGEGLGANSGRSPSLKPGNLVFLVKGELLRRYPETLVYAVKTVIKDGDRTLGDEQKFPVFEGRLNPDILFFGFDLIESDVEGSNDPAEDQGWYFLLQERPTEPLFGLDSNDGRYGAQPGSWLDLNWAQLASGKDALESLAYVDLDAELPDTSLIVPASGEPALAWHINAGRGPKGANSSDIAYITLQPPFRVAIHGSDMLAGERA
jgi:hypothetical protein